MKCVLIYRYLHLHSGYSSPQSTGKLAKYTLKCVQGLMQCGNEYELQRSKLTTVIFVYLRDRTSK